SRRSEHNESSEPDQFRQPVFRHGDRYAALVFSPAKHTILIVGQPILAAAAFQAAFPMRNFPLPHHYIRMEHYERRLPHWDTVGQPLFVTFRLHNSLPTNRVFPPERLTTGQAFVAMDRILDAARSGPLYLQHPQIA